MAIIIQNVSEQNGKEYGKGIQVYELKINDKCLCMFSHNFEDGLAECLRTAGEAFDYAENFGIKKYGEWL